MDITRYMLCKKPRRSNRLVSKEIEEQKEKSIKQALLGYFDVLPIELKFLFLEFLSGKWKTARHYLV